ncbi:hypothetical protein QSH57_000220 [Fusarium oxysporum f. sp. vasinfectum]|nr:hypothetical protein QSH57_000220 [Fusarium oxysporum f. sp. vasinfectum]
MTEGIEAFFFLTDAHSSKDIDYHRLFSEPLTKPGGTNSYEGYLRALQLYGREAQLVNSHKVHRYDRWDGYNPSGGSSNPFTGTYFPNHSLDGPSLNQADTDPSVIYPHTPQRQVTLTQTQTSPSSLATEAIADDMAPPRRDASGRFTPGESAFPYHTSAGTAIGAAENALLLAELIKKLLNNKITTELRQETKPILTTMRDIKGLTASVTKIKAEQAPQPSNQFGSAVRAIHDFGGSGGTSELFNNSPTPIDLTNFPSARKRRATKTTEPDSDEDLLAQFDEPADQAQDVLPVIPRRWPCHTSSKTPSPSAMAARLSFLSF